MEDWSPDEFAQIFFPSIVHRGRDAFGYMYCETNRKTGADRVMVYRQAGAAIGRNLNSLNIPDNVRWLVGHVRLATHGSPKYNPNNHPIRHGNIVGVHNGVISNFRTILGQTGREDEKAEVDSEAIFASVNKWGLQKGLSKLEGGMASAFVHLDRPRTVYLARSHYSPLILARTRAGTLLFASESSVIDACGVEHGGHSAVGQNRLLTVRHGKIIKRVQYATPDHNFTSKRRAPEFWTPSHSPFHGITDALDKRQPGKLSAEDYRRMGLVPPTQVIREERKQREQRVRVTNSGQDQQETKRSGMTHWYNGKLLNDEEYAEALMAEEDAEVRRLRDWLSPNSPKER